MNLAHKKLFAATLVLSLVLGASWALFSFAANQPTAKTQSTGQVSIKTSNGAGPILVTSRLSPTQPQTGQVRLINDGSVPVDIDVEGSTFSSSGPIADDVFRLRLSFRGDQVYAGPVRNVLAKNIGRIEPGRSAVVKLTGLMTNAYGNLAENQLIRFNLDWKAVRAVTPAPRICRSQQIRARLFIFRNRPAIRLIGRYRSDISTRVRFDYYWRVRQAGRWVKGARVGSTSRWFEATAENKWRLFRSYQLRSPKVIRQLQRSRYGFIATIRPARSPQFCEDYLNVDLTQMRRNFRQFTWFQQGSFQLRLKKR